MSVDLKNIVCFTTYELNSKEKTISTEAILDWLKDNCQFSFNVMTMKEACVFHFSKPYDFDDDIPTLSCSTNHVELWIQFEESSDATLFKLTWK